MRPQLSRDPLGGETCAVRVLANPIHRLVSLVSVASAYTFCVNGGIITGTDLADYAAGYGPPYFAALWAFDDARRTRYWPAYHYGLFLWFGWLLLIPHYVLKTRGRAGIRLAAALWLVLWAPALAGLAGWWLYEDLPDFR